MINHTTAHCPECNAVLVRASGTYPNGSRILNDWIINHPTCQCVGLYSKFIKEVPVPENCLVVWGESVS